ncbi:MAG: DNA primase [Candidatus Taylorbacteria bacterium]|nr:DNA primase [Candidatus Taylorbacteria bacterium]
MSGNVEQIKERLSITEVLGSYVKLEKAGSNYKARCPFHNEKTPSFFVSPARGSYYCFGCSSKGDIFSFVEQFEGLDFVGALKVLAQRAGVELTRENPKVRNEKERLYLVLEAATDFFEKKLEVDEESKAYLLKRGVKNESIKNWRLGFAPDSWRSLYEELIKQRFSAEEMQGAGLVRKSETSSGFYDMFRGRIMFPIFDSSDRVIGFSGRILPRLDDGKMGKYVNSPETILFNKSRVLYGLNKAKLDVRKRDYSIMVEGQMDLVMSHQAGFTNTVAVSGTALSNDTMVDGSVTNLGLVQRLSNNIILAFDSDEAGFKASGRNAKIALSLGMDVKVAKMPKGDDPADIILRDSEEWKNIIKNSKHVIDFTLETLLEKNLESRKLGKEVELQILPYIAVLKSAIDQSHFIVKISKAAGIKEEALWSELKKISMSTFVPVSDDFKRPEPIKTGRKSAIEKKIIGIIYWQESMDSSLNLSVEFRGSLKSILGEKRLEELLAATLPNKNDLIFEAELSYDKTSNLKRETDELMLNLEEETLALELSEAMSNLYKAEQAKNQDEITGALKTCHELSAKITALRARRHAATP